jgi:hypothetical protein
MSSPKFERVKKGNPGLADFLDRLLAYLRAQVRAGRTVFIPKLAAAYLHLNDGEAFVLLDILAQAGLLERIYNVYCRRNQLLLATVANAGALDDVPHCDECDADHDISELRVEVAFRLKDSGLVDEGA